MAIQYNTMQSIAKQCKKIREWFRIGEEKRRGEKRREEKRREEKSDARIRQ